MCILKRRQSINSNIEVLRSFLVAFIMDHEEAQSDKRIKILRILDWTQYYFLVKKARGRGESWTSKVAQQQISKFCQFFLPWARLWIWAPIFLGERKWWRLYTRCLKITEKVSFNIASEASYVYILSGQKLIKSAKKWSIWRVFKTWTLRSNSVTRQVSFNRTKIGGKCQI